MEQRKLKFRVWTGEEMLYPKDIGNFAIDDLRNKFWKSVMQFINQKDINGNDIYENDIIELADGNRGCVIFENNGFCHTAKTKIMGLQYWHKKIGNIFENPELLEKQ